MMKINNLEDASAFSKELFFERVFEEGLAQASYVVGDREVGQAIVIDPKRDIDVYLHIARSQNVKITHVAETHIHADFLSGSRELAAATGAELLLSAEGGEEWQYSFPHKALRDGDKIEIGRFILEVMHTPGHTPESITWLVVDPEVSDEPLKAITGDFIFVGDVGRPDLLEKAVGKKGSQEIGAKQLYASIQRFTQLPDDLEIWPGHGAGSFCGKSLSSIPQSTLKQEKMTSWAFQFAGDEEGFVKYVLEDQPQVPRYFARMKYLNRAERPLLIEVPQRVKIDKEKLLQGQERGLLVVDTRKKEKVAKGFIPHSLHIEGGGAFSTWMGSLVGYDEQLILIAEEEEIEALTRKLMRIGMDNVYGFVTVPEQMEIPLLQSELVELSDVKQLIERPDMQIVDVRTAREYSQGHIKGAENIPLTDLEGNADKVDKNKPVIVHCQSGTRAAMADSILRKNGFENVKNYSAGMKEWTKEGNETVQ